MCFDLFAALNKKPRRGWERVACGGFAVSSSLKDRKDYCVGGWRTGTVMSLQDSSGRKSSRIRNQPGRVRLSEWPRRGAARACGAAIAPLPPGVAIAAPIARRTCAARVCRPGTPCSRRCCCQAIAFLAKGRSDQLSTARFVTHAPCGLHFRQLDVH